MIIKPLIFPITSKYGYFYHTDSQEHTQHGDRERQLYSACTDSWSLYNGAAGRRGTDTKDGFNEFSLKLQCFAKPGDIEDTELSSSATGKRCAPSKTASCDLRNRLKSSETEAQSFSKNWARSGVSDGPLGHLAARK